MPRKPNLKLRGNTLDVLKKAICVYVWRRGRRYLFVAATSNFAARFSTHNVIGKAEPILPADSIEIFACKDLNAAKRLEERIQRKHMPLYSPPLSMLPHNLDPRPCLVCKEIFTPKRWWQKYCLKCSRGI